MYSSAAEFPLDEAEVAALLGESRERNAAVGITGVLLYIRLDYEHAAFLQVLEGPDQAVEETYRRIERDELHRGVTVLSGGAFAQLRYRRWTMMFVEIDRAALCVAAGAGPEADTDTDALLRDRGAMAAVLDQCS